MAKVRKPGHMPRGSIKDAPSPSPAPPLLSFPLEKRSSEAAPPRPPGSVPDTYDLPSAPAGTNLRSFGSLSVAFTLELTAHPLGGLLTQPPLRTKEARREGGAPFPLQVCLREGGSGHLTRNVRDVHHHTVAIFLLLLLRVCLEAIQVPRCDLDRQGHRPSARALRGWRGSGPLPPHAPTPDLSQGQ